MIAELKRKAFESTRLRAVRTWRVPRRAYAHYFIETEGLHSRIHLQNYWSTFWPQFESPAVAHVQVFDRGGRRLGTADRTIAPFGSAFIEMRELLSELGADAEEGTVAIDLEPSNDVRGALGDLPNPLNVEVNTPYWMAYYDANENYMYVHSIDKLGGEVYGTTGPLRWALTRPIDDREVWRSWRLLDLDRLSELQVVAINHSTQRRSSTIGLYTANDDTPIVTDSREFGPRELHRVRFTRDDLARGAGALATPAEHGRIGMDPLLTGNGKPYVLLRYGDGPLSLHHG